MLVSGAHRLWVGTCHSLQKLGLPAMLAISTEKQLPLQLYALEVALLFLSLCLMLLCVCSVLEVPSKDHQKMYVFLWCWVPLVLYYNVLQIVHWRLVFISHLMHVVPFCATQVRCIPPSKLWVCGMPYVSASCSASVIGFKRSSTCCQARCRRICSA